MRRGTSLVEVLVALGVLSCGVFAAYFLLVESFGGFKRLDRRQVAESISLSIHERYFHTPPSELLEKFGGRSGGRDALKQDPALEAVLDRPLGAQKDAFDIHASAVPLEQGDGSSA